MKTHQASPQFCNCAICSQPCSVFKNLIQLINFWVTWWLCVLNKRECFSGNLCSFLFFLTFFWLGHCMHISTDGATCAVPWHHLWVSLFFFRSRLLKQLHPVCTVAGMTKCVSLRQRSHLYRANLYKCYMSVQFTVKIRFWEELNIYVNMEADLWVFGMESSVLEEIKLSKYNDPNITQELIEVF